MKYNKRSKKSPYQKGGRAPCLDSVPSSCYKVIVNLHGVMRYEDKDLLTDIDFPFASIKYYVPNGRTAYFEPDWDLPSYLGDICNDRPELIIEDIPKDDTPNRIAVPTLYLHAVSEDLTTIEQDKRVDEGTMIDVGNGNAPNYGGIYLCNPAPLHRALGALREKEKINEILSPTPREILAPPNALRQREEKIRTRNQKYALPRESAIKLFSDRELIQIPNLYNSDTGSVRNPTTADNEIIRNLIRKLKPIQPIVDTQEMQWDAADAEDAAKASAVADAVAKKAVKDVGMEYAASALADAAKAMEKAMEKAEAATHMRYKKFYDWNNVKKGPEKYAKYNLPYKYAVHYKIDEIIRLVIPQLEQRNINIANCELCIFSCRGWTPVERRTGFKADTPEAVAADKSTGAPPTRFANYTDFITELDRRKSVLSKKSEQMEKDEIGISKYTTNKAEKRKQNEDWLIRRALGLSPRKDVPDRLQNIYMESVIRTDDPKNVLYTLQNGDEYGRYTPVWNAEWANLKQRWYRNGEPYNPATMANIAKGRELVLRKDTSPALIQQTRDFFINMQAREALSDKPHIPVTLSQLIAYLLPLQRPSMEEVLEAVTPEELKNYVIVDEQDNPTKLLVDIQKSSMDSVNDRQCPSHDKIPQPCTTPENSYKKQLLVFHPDKNLKCPEAATEKFKYFNAICKEPDNTAGGSKTRKRRKTRRRRINMRRRKTRRR